MKRLASLLLLVIATAVSAQSGLSLKGDGVKVVKVDKVIIVQEDATVVQSFPVTVNAAPGSGLYFWSYGSDVVAVDKGDSLEIRSAPKGQCTISVKAISPNLDKDGKFLGFVTKFDSITFAVGNVPPGPDPKPDPKPDPVIPAPLPIPGILFIEEQADRAKISLGQYNAMFGKDMRDWIIANVAKEDGVPAFKLLDKDQNVTAIPKHWQDAFKKRPANFSSPWIVVSNGIMGWEGPMPNTEAEIKTLLTKYLVKSKGAK